MIPAELRASILDLIPRLKAFIPYDYEGLCSKSADVFSQLLDVADTPSVPCKQSADRPNLTRLLNGTYEVRTQAGFRRLERLLKSKGNLVLPSYGPPIYPSVVFIEYPRGSCSLKLTCVHVNTYLKHLESLMEQIKDA